MNASAKTLSSPDVSIVIVNWNTRDVLRQCLSSVYAGTRGADFEVIVVDNASSDGSAAMVRAEFPQASLIANEANRGYGAALNQGLLAARGRYLLSMNADIAVSDGALEKIVRFADERPEAGCFGCRVVTPEGELSQTAVMFPTLLNIALGLLRLDQHFNQHPFFDRERLGSWNYDTVGEVPTLVGCFMLFRREALARVGGFDERYFLFCEETDICLRLKKAHWPILFFPGATVVHHHGASMNLLPDRLYVQRRRSLLMFLTQYRGRPMAWAANLMFLAAAAARAPFWIYCVLRGGSGGYNRPQDLRSILCILAFHAKMAVWPKYIFDSCPKIPQIPSMEAVLGNPVE